MKRIAASVLASVFLMGSLCACSSGANDDSKKRIVTTIFPEYDWVMNILGDKADEFEVTLLMDNGTDLHSYQPSVDDLAKIYDCDIFIYVGGESDAWVEDALELTDNKDRVTINLIDELGSAAVEEEMVEGMTGEEEEEDSAYDEHVWLSLRNARILCESIGEAISSVDPDNKDVYEANLASYDSMLEELDLRYVEAVEDAQFDTLVFADRFPFRYMVEDYDLSYYAAFPGCSAETEASFETIVFLSDRVDELGVGALLTIDDDDRTIAQAVIENTTNGDQQIVTLNSLQSVTTEEMNSGTTYLSVMNDNLLVLEEALN